MEKNLRREWTLQLIPVGRRREVGMVTGNARRLMTIRRAETRAANAHPEQQLRQLPRRIVN
jgi:hypothetical protein